MIVSNFVTKKIRILAIIAFDSSQGNGKVQLVEGQKSERMANCRQNFYFSDVI